MESFKRVEIYKGRVIITNGKIFMRFWSETRYPTLEALKAQIDLESI